ncbi:hypothetical protein BBG19_1006 [Francisella sp. MA067296]|nr:hypothetical protein BBG19_1006 [Francisella sp. MA067296]
MLEFTSKNKSVKNLLSRYIQSKEFIVQKAENLRFYMAWKGFFNKYLR